MTLFLTITTMISLLTIALFLTGPSFLFYCSRPSHIFLKRCKSFGNAGFISGFTIWMSPIGIIGTAFSKNISYSHNITNNIPAIVIPRKIRRATISISAISFTPYFRCQSKVMAFFNQFGIGAILQILARFFMVNNIVPFFICRIDFVVFNYQLLSSFKVFPHPSGIAKIIKIMLTIFFCLGLISRKNRYKDN